MFWGQVLFECSYREDFRLRVPTTSVCFIVRNEKNEHTTLSLSWSASFSDCLFTSKVQVQLRNLSTFQSCRSTGKNQRDLNFYLDMDPNSSIFFPYAVEETIKAKDSGGRFAYYTTADVATSILIQKKLWMRNTRVMNDFMEVAHGFECLRAARESELGKQFDYNLDACFPGLSTKVNDLFNAWMPAIKSDTYITCISAHQESEDAHGRLSMWRAYGGKTGTAIIIKTPAIFETAPNSGIFVSPVGYFTTDQFKTEFSRVVNNIGSNVERLRSLGREILTAYIFTVFRSAVLCTKHPGFAEEQEWRIISSPSMFKSPLTDIDVEVVRGTPQRVLKLNMRNRPEHQITTGIELPEILNKIIIGPCEFPDITYTAFHQLLTNLNVAQPEAIITRSEIPLRHF